MAKYWDIKRRKKRKKITPTEKKERKLNASWLFFLCLIGTFFIVFAGTSKKPENSEPISSPVPSVTLSSTTLSKAGLNIKFINGTGLFEELNKATTILSQNGYKANLTENALNTYPETIIYYEAPAERYAKDLESVLKYYKPKTRILSQDTIYDLIIVIGKN